MENHKNTEVSFTNPDTAGVILGTSSDAIIEGLHHGDFIDTDAPGTAGNDGDKEKIVNEQEQNEIVNPVEKDYQKEEAELPEKTTEESPAETGSLKKKAL